MDEDLWLERSEDPRVVEWALRQSREAEVRLRHLSRLLYPRMKKYYGMPIILALEACREGCYVLSMDSKGYTIRLVGRNGGGRVLVDSRRLGGDAVIPPFGLRVRGEGDRLAYTYSRGGADHGVTRVIDTRDGQVLDELTGLIGGIIWLDPERYYYVRHYRWEATPDGVSPPASRVFLREGGRDVMVFGGGLATNHLISVKASGDGSRALIAVSYGWARGSVYGGRLGDPENWMELLESEAPVWPIDYLHGRYYLASYERELGSVVVLEGDGERRAVVEEPYPLQGAALTRDRLICHFLEDAHARLALYTLEGKLVKPLELRPPGSLLGPEQVTTYRDEAFFAYSSFAIPYRLYRLQADELHLLEARELRLDLKIRDIWATSSDGTKIHAFLVHRRGVRPRKLLVYGYGGFRISQTPTYLPYLPPFLEDGGGFVMCNLRGGLEYGERWHREGMREKKPKVFHDFIAVLQALRAKGARLVAMGVSNGGLLVGATLTMRPDLLDGAIIGYPVLDMLRFHRLHAGRAWVPEYGDPEDPKDAEFLRRYSPYHNLREGVRYPPTLIHTGLHDDRVHPSHAYRFYEKLRRLGAPVLLRVEKASGHAGAKPGARIREQADRMAFAYQILKLELKGTG